MVGNMLNNKKVVHYYCTIKKALKSFEVDSEHRRVVVKKNNVVISQPINEFRIGNLQLTNKILFIQRFKEGFQHGARVWFEFL